LPREKSLFTSAPRKNRGVAARGKKKKFRFFRREKEKEKLSVGLVPDNGKKETLHGQFLPTTGTPRGKRKKVRV